MTLRQVATALESLRVQLRDKAVSEDTEYDEIVFTEDAIRLRRQGKTLKVPLVQAWQLNSIRTADGGLL